MKIILTSYCNYLSPYFTKPIEQNILKRFSDGELYVSLSPEIKNDEVVVVSATAVPSRNITELLFVLDALIRQHNSVSLCLLYYGYARQDKIKPGEALAAQVIAKCIRQFPLKKIWIVHPHSTYLHDFLSFESIIPYDLMYKIQQKNSYDLFIAPDKGAQSMVKKIGDLLQKPVIFAGKTRSGPERIEHIDLPGDMKGKKILIIDDLIATGNTAIKVAALAQYQEAELVDIFATHAIFSNQALENIEKSSINRIYVTNTLNSNKSSSKVTTLNIIPFIESIIAPGFNVQNRQTSHMAIQAY